MQATHDRDMRPVMLILYHSMLLLPGEKGNVLILEEGCREELDVAAHAQSAKAWHPRRSDRSRSRLPLHSLLSGIEMSSI